MNRDKLKEMYQKYELDASDVFKHQHFLIITRSGIEKIQAKEDIKITYEVIKCETNFAVVKAKTEHLQTFGSALKGATYKDGNTNSWYLMELAEKRAMSRIVLKTCNLYQLGVMGEDESESFKRK
jgi:hypothetical protein